MNPPNFSFNPQPPPPYPPSQIPQVSRTFQSIEDFVREQDQLDAVKSAELKARAATALANSNPKKFKKAPIDVEAVAAEARAVAEIEDTNWTGRLGEYRAAHPTAVKGLEYTEIGTGKFRCTVKIHEAPHIQFGDSNVSFTKKKDAKQFASKKAIDWLIYSGFMPPNGAVRWPKPTPIPAAKVIGPKIPTTALTQKATTFAGQIPELCHSLGFKIPTYKIERISEEAPLYKGYAHFPGDPRIEGKIGEVTDIYGQKNAKEKIAAILWSFLKDIERQRLEKHEEKEEEEEEEEEDRKRKRSQTPGEDQNTGKVIKVEEQNLEENVRESLKLEESK
ncbi:hypothetical protein B0O99DRAFT_686679 [Bisporella sp. PMI_857]|nr:hypothetical protein B0O99DRAFT_686679 [Bisporella sp. PMI_857]